MPNKLCLPNFGLAKCVCQPDIPLWLPNSQPHFCGFHTCRAGKVWPGTKHPPSIIGSNLDACICAIELGEIHAWGSHGDRSVPTPSALHNVLHLQVKRFHMYLACVCYRSYWWWCRWRQCFGSLHPRSWLRKHWPWWHVQHAWPTQHWWASQSNGSAWCFHRSLEYLPNLRLILLDTCWSY
jgi:hypothetical protein